MKWSGKTGTRCMMPDNLNERYARHLALPDFTESHQRRLSVKSALLVGAGGLGGNIAPLLCAAGIGRLVLIDGDKVSLSNLQRQTLYREDQIGKWKTECAAQSLHSLNSGTRIEAHPVFIDRKNALTLAKDCDIVIDGCDNALCRYLMNDLAVGLGIPFVYGSICEYSGQAAVFNATKDSATYRCLYPEENARQNVPKGVTAPLPALVAAVEAQAALRILCGMDSALSNRLFLCDMLSMESHCLDLQASGKGREISLANFRKFPR